MLIFSMISMSDDSFASESLTIEYVLSNNEISYSLKLLIDIKAADYLFIDEVITQIVCDKSVVKLKLSWVERNQLNLSLSSSWDWIDLS